MPASCAARLAPGLPAGAAALLRAVDGEPTVQGLQADAERGGRPALVAPEALQRGEDDAALDLLDRGADAHLQRGVGVGVDRLRGARGGQRTRVDGRVGEDRGALDGVLE